VSTLLNINNYHYRRGGAEAVYFDQTELFEQRGWTVTSFSMKHAANLPADSAAYFVDEIEYTGTYGPARVLTNAAKAIYSWEAADKLSALILNQRPDVAHAHNVYHHLSPSVLRTAKGSGIPVFLTLHDVKLLCPARTMTTASTVCEACKSHRLHNVVLKRCLKSSLALSALIAVESVVHRLLDSYRRHVDKFIAPSRFLIQKFVEWGWDRDRFVHIPNHIAANRLEPAFRPGKAFLFFGRLTPEKGVATLIEAAAEARVPLWIMGTGPQENELQRLARRLAANVSFLGYKTGPALWQTIRESRAVVVPSEWYENAPVGILEAYCLGKPVIGANIGGIPEMIRPDITGALFGSGQVGQLTELLRRFATLPDRQIEDWGRAGREFTIDQFSPQTHYEQLSALYSSFGVNLPHVRRN
jgi:glycosyltransferase involved in cell wall biosynthesis